MWLRWKMDGMSQLARTDRMSSTSASPTMDQPAQSNQTANVTGDGNMVVIVNGDLNGPLPTLSSPPPAPAPNPRPRRSGWWLGSSTAAVALAITGLIANSLVFHHEPPNPVAATSHIAFNPVVSSPAAADLSRSVKAADSPAPSPPGRNNPAHSLPAADARSRSPATSENQPLLPPDTWPDGKSALCNDRSFSASQRRSGTCSWHGGVAHWRYPAEHSYWQRA